MNEENLNTKTVVMYQAFKIPEAFDQVIFSVLTLFHHLKGDFSRIHPVIFTDDATSLCKVFPNGLVTVIEVQPETINQYLGEHKYFHRMRHLLIRDCFEQFKCNLLYVDGDTFFLQSPEHLIKQISKDISIMHIREFTLDDGGDFEGKNWLEIRKLARNNVFKIKGEQVKIPFYTSVWNAGVLGIAYKNKELIPETVSLIDQFLEVTSVFTLEQIAIGFNLQRNTQILPAEAYIFHYWPEDLKKAYNHFIRGFLSQFEQMPLPELAAKAFEASRQKDRLPRIAPTFLDRVKLRLSLIKQVAFKGTL